MHPEYVRLIVLFHNLDALDEFVEKIYGADRLAARRIIGTEIETQIPSDRTYRLALPERENNDNP